MAKKPGGVFICKTQGQQTEKNTLEFDSHGINLEDVSLSDSVTKEGCFRDLQ